jgi:pimeloyl-ACP methyl ester carboxylesterase
LTANTAFFFPNRGKKCQAKITQENFDNNENWINLYKSSPLGQDQTWKWSLNLIEQIPVLDVPVFFFAGRFDYKASYILVKEYYNVLAAPGGKQIILFENSAHIPHIEERDAFHTALINVVLPSIN